MLSIIIFAMAKRIWLVVSSPLKKLVSWDYLFPTEWKNKIHVPNHQPGMQFWWYPNDSDTRKSWPILDAMHFLAG